MRLLIILSLFFFSLTVNAQFQGQHSSGKYEYLETWLGGLKVNRGLINSIYPDTATANTMPIATYAGGQIWVNDTIYIRNSTATRWLKQNIGSGSGSSTFVGLTDGPGSFSGQAGKSVRVNVGETALEYFTPSAASNPYVDLPLHYDGDTIHINEVSSIDDGYLSAVNFAKFDSLRNDWWRSGSRLHTINATDSVFIGTPPTIAHKWNLVGNGYLVGVVYGLSNRRVIHVDGGGQNAFFGSRSGNDTYSGAVENFGGGELTLGSITSGDNNTAIGKGAGFTLTTGSNNTFIGRNVHGSGGAFTGVNNVAIEANVPDPTASNQLNINDWLYGNDGRLGIGATAASHTPTAAFDIDSTVDYPHLRLRMMAADPTVINNGNIWHAANRLFMRANSVTETIAFLSDLSASSTLFGLAGTNVATGAVIGDLDGNTLQVQQGGNSFLSIDPTANNEAAYLRAFNTTGDDNYSVFTAITDAAAADASVIASFNGEASGASIIAHAESGLSSITHTADSHTFIAGGQTNGVISLDNSLIRAFDPTNDDNISYLQAGATTTESNFTIQADFNDGVKRANILGIADVSASTITHTADSHILNGAVTLNDGTASAGYVWTSTDGTGLGNWQPSAGGGNVSNTGTPLNNQLAIWTNATTVEGDANLTFSSSTLSIGVAGSSTGILTLSGVTSGTVTIQPASVAGTYTLTIPANDGDANQFLQTNGSGVTIWADAPVNLTNTVTLTNKRITRRVGGTTSSATPTPASDDVDIYELTALAAGATFGIPTGTPTNGQGLVMLIKDNGGAQTLAFTTGAGGYIAGDVSFPTTTVAGKEMVLGWIYSSNINRWMLVAKIDNF